MKIKLELDLAKPEDAAAWKIISIYNNSKENVVIMTGKHYKEIEDSIGAMVSADYAGAFDNAKRNADRTLKSIQNKYHVKIFKQEPANEQ